MNWLYARLSASLLLSATLAALFVTPAAPVAAAPSAECPAVMPVSRLRAMLAAERDGSGPAVVGQGLTVTRGTEPETFAAGNFSVLDDGLGPDRDLILADLSGAGIDGPGGAGVWAGMSGSPVYVGDDLVGAVAYSLSFGPTPLAGITPAEDMVKLLSGVAPAAAPRRVELSARQRRQVAAHSALAAGAELRALPVPLSLSSVGPKRMAWLRDQAVADSSPLLPVAGGSGAAAAAPGDVADIKAGGNFAAALSYGDITAAGIGTTTMVCGDEALAFGHPFSWSGATTLSTSGAVADRIIRDPVFGGFKLATPSAAVGRVTADRFAGLRAVLGSAFVPPMTPITSRVVAKDARDRIYNTDTGRSDVVRRRDLPFVALLHTATNIDYGTDRLGAGSSRMAWRVDGTYQGEPFTLYRVNRYASRQDIAFASVFEMYGNLARLQRFPGAPRIDDVSVRATVVTQNRYRRITDLKVRIGNRYRSVAGLRGYVHTPGRPLQLRVELLDHTGNRIVRDIALGMSRRVLGPARVVAHGGDGGGEDPFCFLFGECSGRSASAGTFQELLDDLQKAPRNDDLAVDSTWLRVGERRPVERTRRTRVDQVVRGRIAFRFQVGASAPERPAPEG